MFVCSMLMSLALAGASHAGPDVTSLLVPCESTVAGGVPPQPTFFRGKHSFLVYSPAQGHHVGLTVTARQVGAYEDRVEAALVDATRIPPVTLAEGSAPPGGQIELSAEAPRQGVLALHVRAGQNAATVEPGEQWLAVEASRTRPLHIISRAGPLYFLAPPNTTNFSVGVKGQGTGENVRVRVCSADGPVIAEAATREGAEAMARVQIPPAPGGAVLRLDLGPAEEGIFEDAAVWLSEEVPPYVGIRADRLLVPFVQGLVTPPVLLSNEKPTPLPFALNTQAESLAARRWEVSLTPARGVNAPRLALRRPVAMPSLSLELPPDTPDGDYELQARLLGEGEVMASGTSPLLVRQGVAYVGGWQPLASAELVHGAGGQTVPELLVHRRAVPLADGVEAIARLQAVGDLDPLVERSLDLAVGGALAPVRELEPGHYRWRVAVSRRGGPLPVDWDDHCFYWRGDRAFEEVRPPAPQGPLTAVSEAGLARGFVAFVPEDVEAIPYNTRPTAEDVARDARIFAARGEYEPATIGVFSLRDGAEVGVKVRPLSGPQGIPAEQIDVRVARYWAQRMSWNSETYHFIPELLERRNAVRLNACEVGQIWLTVRVPVEAPAGVYRGEVELTSGSGTPVTKRLEVEVLPFSLVKPTNMGWGLYTDSARWNAYPPERVEAELADIVAHGYTTLLLYPLQHSRITYEEGELEVDLSPFEAYMRMAIEAGLGGPWVMDLQALQGAVQNLLGRQDLVYDEEFEKVFTGICAALRDAAEASDWGEILLHVVDEPNRRSPESVEKAKRQLALAQSVGCRTWTTVLDLEALAEEYDPQLDVRCYSLSFIIGSEEANRGRREETAASGDELQWYGSGCYTFAGGQEGHLFSNRILMGYLFAKSGATTQYTWTFQRPKADPYDDFDGEVQAQAKDACTTYPDESNTELARTLQWEGCREGIDDARYVATLREAIREAADRPAGAKAEAELERLLESVGWGIRPPNFTNRDAQRTRRAIADLIVQLRGAG